MRVLVTGGTGFVGSHIVDRLVADGHDVVVAKRVSSNLRWLSPDKIELIDAPMEHLEPLSEILPEMDAVVHASGIVRARDRSDFYRVNLAGTARLAELCARHGSKLRRFVFISSQAAGRSGVERDGVCESTPERPISAYGRSKLEAERILSEFSEVLPITVLRPPTVYGPRDRDVFIFFKLIEAGFKVFLGNPDRQFSAIYVEDLARAVEVSLEKGGADFAKFFVTDGQTHTWREFAGVIARTLKRKTITLRLPKVAFWPVAIAAELAAIFSKAPPMLTLEKANEISRDWVCDGSLFAREAGFRPEYNLERGIEKTAHWYRENGWI